MSIADSSATDARTVALDYHSRGWAVLPLPRRSKRPTLDGWQSLRLDAQGIAREIRNPRANVGVLLGKPSGWLIDVDLDHPLAVEMADKYLPATGAEFGRASKPRSHRLYRVTAPVETHQRRLPKVDGKAPMVVELRSTGAQTVFPGSVRGAEKPNEVDERIEWHADGPPAEIAPEELQAAVDALADAVEARLGLSRTPAPSVNGHAKRPTTSIIDRARKYVAKMPAAIAGQGGHDATFAVACELYRFGLDDDDARHLLDEYNARCEPEWSDKELAHKLADAKAEVEGKGEFGMRLKDDRNGKPKGEATPLARHDDHSGPRPIADAEGRTDAGNAARFIAAHGDNVRWCEPWQTWLVWDGRRWKRDDERRVEALAKKTAAKQWKAVADAVTLGEASDTITAMMGWARKSNSAAGIRDTLAMARSEDGIPVQPAALDCDPWLLNFSNGTLDLKTGKLHPHRREDYITQLAPVEYLAPEEVECPVFHAFMDAIFDGKQSLIGFLQRLLGYCLTGRTTEQVLPIFHGVGANGKSTLLNLILELLGDYACKAPPNLLVQKRGEVHPTEKAALFGKRFIFDCETDQGRRLNEALVKDLTGSDIISARRMREDFWTFMPTHKIILATNHRPEVQGTDHAIWRRLRLVPFNVVIAAQYQDKHLPDKLRAELPGILRWLVDGCLAWQREGLGEPAEVKAATESYRQSEDQLGRFLATCCVLADHARAGSTELLKAYHEFTGDSGMNSTRFAKALEDRGLQNHRVTSGIGKGRMAWHGVGLVTSED